MFKFSAHELIEWTLWEGEKVIKKKLINLGALKYLV